MAFLAVLFFLVRDFGLDIGIRERMGIPREVRRDRYSTGR